MSYINEEEIIDLTKPIIYDKSRCYLKSTLNVLGKEGMEIPSGYNGKD